MSSADVNLKVDHPDRMRFAKRLRLDAIDATKKGRETKSSWDDLDENLAKRRVRGLETPARNPHPPPDSGLEIVFNQGRKEILISPLGFSKGLIFLFLFGGIFTAMGTFAPLSVLGVIDVPVSGSGILIGNSNYRNRKDEIVVRADSTILRFGQSLGDTARIWLESACQYAAVNGQLP